MTTLATPRYHPVGGAVIAIAANGCRLPVHQLAMLVMIAARPDLLSVKDFLKPLALSRPTASRNLDALAHRGFVLHRQNPADRRLLQMLITDDGHAYLTRLGLLTQPELAA